ncbi:MAG: undecaprenyldiphospho-muramoylpentapeptide beta-N-acetylglucosaminyltransferase [bacterium]
MSKFVITGGGTGGHIYPGIAIAKALLQLEPKAKIIFIGGKGQRESVIVPKSGFDFEPILVQGFPRSLSLRWFKVLVKVPMGFCKSLSILSRFNPDVVIATGGYVSGPVALAAFFLGIPVVIQEQNTMPGITNKIMGLWAKKIFLSFSEARVSFPSNKTYITGNPIREEITTITDCREKLGLDKNKITIAFIGGSQGARSINLAVIEALEYLTEYASKIQMIHQTGEPDFSMVKKAYSRSPFSSIIQPFFYSIEEVYSSSDLVVCRSGAMTLAEITACGLPAILVPYPYAAGNEQTFNAKVLQDKGAAIMINDSQLTGKLLAETLISLIDNKEKLMEMASKSRSLGKPNAAQKIAKEIISLI